MSSKIYHTILSNTALEVISDYKNSKDGILSKNKKYKKFVDLLKNKDIKLSELFPNTSDAEMKKYYTLEYDDIDEKKVSGLMKNNEIFESHYIKPPDEYPM